MIKHIIVSFSLLLLCSSSTNFSMQRQNAGKNDNEEIIEKKQTKNFSSLTFSEITEEKCIICYETLKTQDTAITILACQHALHDPCFTKLKEYKFTSCPSCHAKIKYSQEGISNSEEINNNCIMCIVKSKNCIIGSIESLSGTLIEESHDCMTDPKDYFGKHILELRSLFNSIWGSYRDE